jgi:hypothetical protein
LDRKDSSKVEGEIKKLKTHPYSTLSCKVEGGE